MRPGEGREGRLGEKSTAVGADFGDGVVVRQRNINCVVFGRDAGGSSAAHGLSACLGDLRAEAQLGGYRWMLAVAHVISPKGTAADRVFIAQAGNLLAFDHGAVARSFGGVSEGREMKAGVDRVFVIGAGNGRVLEQPGVGDVEPRCRRVRERDRKDTSRWEQRQ